MSTKVPKSTKFSGTVHNEPDTTVDSKNTKKPPARDDSESVVIPSSVDTGSPPKRMSYLHTITTPPPPSQPHAAKTALTRTVQGACFDSPGVATKPKQNKSSKLHTKNEDEVGSSDIAGRCQQRGRRGCKSTTDKKTIAQSTCSMPSADHSPGCDDGKNSASLDHKQSKANEELVITAIFTKDEDTSLRLPDKLAASSNLTTKPVADDRTGKGFSSVVANPSEGTHNNASSAVGRRKSTAIVQPPSRKITEFFTVRRSSRTPANELKKQELTDLHESIRLNKHDGLAVADIPGKGRGVVADRPFTKGEFVVEYAGDLIGVDEARGREKKYATDKHVGCYMYYFQHKGKSYCIDATEESGLFGRLINHSQKKFNCITKIVELDSLPRLVLITSRDIGHGEEFLYDYGDRSKESLETYPWLAL